MIHALVTLQMLAQRAGERLHEEQEGATAVEYGLMVALIAVVIITAVAAIGTNLNTMFQNVRDCLANVTTC